MGLSRGAVFRHGGGALKQPIKQPTEMPTSTMALMGRFPLLMGRFPSLTGRFTDFVPRSGKEKAHEHKSIFPVTGRVWGGLLTGWPGVSRPVARGQEFMCCVRNPRNINIFVRLPGREDPGIRPGGSVTGVTEKLFMCQMFMCLFRPLQGAVLPLENPLENSPLRKGALRGSWWMVATSLRSNLGEFFFLGGGGGGVFSGTSVRVAT